MILSCSEFICHLQGEGKMNRPQFGRYSAPPEELCRTGQISAPHFALWQTLG